MKHEVKLTVDEIHSDGGFQPVHETIRTYDRAWETIPTTAVSEETGSRMRLRIDVAHLPAGASIRLDDVWISRERPTVAVGPTSDRLDNGCAVSRRGVPVCSAYFGSALGTNGDPTKWDRSLGRPLGVHRTYFAADQVYDAVATARRDVAAGRLPWVSPGLPYTWADMAAGRGDRWVLAVGRRLSSVPGPVWVAFHHEPVGDGRVRDWTAMQQRLAPLVSRTAPNLAGFDLVADDGVGGGSAGRATSLAKAYFAPLSRWAANRGLAWAVAETGYSDAAAELDPAWLYRTYQQLLHHGGVAFSYVNDTGPWALGTPEKRRQFNTRSATRPTSERVRT